MIIRILKSRGWRNGRLQAGQIVTMQRSACLPLIEGGWAEEVVEHQPKPPIEAATTEPEESTVEQRPLRRKHSGRRSQSSQKR